MKFFSVSLQKMNQDVRFSVLINALFAAGFFLLLYGSRVIYPSYDAWLLAGGDAAQHVAAYRDIFLHIPPDLLADIDLGQHYLGWELFRRSAWHFPFGLMDGVLYPDTISVIYTDSIPLFAVVFKLLSPFLPTTFQYFGIWGILSYILQGIFSGLLLWKYKKNAGLCLLAAAFFILSPTVMKRMYIHTALAGQWILLLGLCFLVYRKEINGKLRIVVWGLLAALAVFIHAYFVPMELLFLLGLLVTDFWEDHIWKNNLYTLAAFLAATVLSLYFLGAFQYRDMAAGGGLGLLSSNLNTFYAPAGFSAFLPEQPFVFGGQVDGFAYAGAGILLLALFVFVDRIFIRKEKFGMPSPFSASLAMVAVISFWLALSPVVTLNQHILFTIHYPEAIYKLLSVFRCAGRFIWPVQYLLILSILLYLFSFRDQKKTLLLLLAALSLQAADFYPAIKAVHQEFCQVKTAPLPMQASGWDFVRDFQHISFLPESGVPSAGEKYFYDVARFALQNGQTLDDFYLARSPQKELQQKKADVLAKLIHENADEQTLYFINDESFLLRKDSFLHYYKMDGFLFGTKNEIPSLADWAYHPEKISILPRNGRFLLNGRDEGNVRILEAGGKSFGPYSTLSPASYRITVKGENLNSVRPELTAVSGKERVPFTMISQKNEGIEYVFTLSRQESAVEFIFVNEGSAAVILNDVEIMSLAE